MTPHTPSEIFKNKFGDCKDQAMFLVYLLRSIGVESYPMLVSTIDNIPVDRNIPSPYFFNHVITYIPAQDGITEEIFLDTTSSLTSFGNIPSLDQGADGLVIKKDGTGVFVNIPVIEPRNNLIEEDFRIETDIAGGGKIKYSSNNTGTFSEIIRYPITNKSFDEINSYFLNRDRNMFPNLKKENLSVSGYEKQSGDIGVQLSSEEKNLTNIFYDGRQKISYDMKDIGTLYTLPADPKYDFRNNFLFTYRKKLEYIFPEGYSIIEGEVRNIRKENEYMMYEFSADRISDNHFIFNFEFTLKKRIIKKQDVKSAAEFVASIDNNVNFELTLQNKEGFNDELFYETLLKNYKEKDVYENYIRKLMELDKKDKALEICNEGIKLFPKDMFFYMIKSSILLDNGNFKDAESVLLDALAADKTDPDVYMYLAEVYKKSGDNKKLESMLLDGYTRLQDMNIIRELISYYKRSQLYDVGIGFVKKLIEKKSDNSGYYGELAYFYSLKKDINNAETAFLKSIQINEKNAQSLNNLAWLYCENDVKIKEAVKYAKKACELEPFSDSYLDTLAEAYFKNGEYDNAIETINKAIKINPNYTYLKQQLDKIEKAKSKKIENK
jgi:tetratricopeptide (TPR) repeat protein